MRKFSGQSALSVRCIPGRGMGQKSPRPREVMIREMLGAQQVTRYRWRLQSNVGSVTRKSEGLSWARW